MKMKKIPARALRFDASVEVAEVQAEEAVAGTKGLATVPVTLRARSGEVVNHWWFGRCVHDFAGMTPAADTLPLDYCHSCDDVIGFSDKQDVTSGELVMAGKLVPFHEKDRASEVIHKGSQGVPYQASINFDPQALVIEEVSSGMTVTVNGKELIGPLTIFRQWKLRGAAVCPYGMDSHTSVQFSEKDDRQLDVQCLGELTAEPVEKPAEVPPEVKPEEKPETELSVEVKPETEIKPEVVPTELTAGSAVIEIEIKPKTELSDKPIAPVVPAPNGKQFLEAFGDVGGKWFAEGKSFDEAQTLFTNSLKDQVTALKKTNAEQAALLTANRGEQSPMTFSSAEETVVPKVTVISTLPEGSAKFAANIKMPRR